MNNRAPSPLSSDDSPQSENPRPPKRVYKPRPPRPPAPPPPDGDSSDRKVAFYSKELRPKTHVCPFSATGRDNPCTTHAQPKGRRDVIMHHLQSIKLDGYDISHPEHDPLWEAPIVKDYYLQKRPQKFEPELKKRRIAKSNKNHYYNKATRVFNEGATMKARYESGEITTDEYKTFLIGAARARFVEEQKVTAEVSKRIEELRATLNPNDQQAVTNLQGVEMRLKASYERSENAKEQLMMILRELLGWWSMDPIVRERRDGDGDVGTAMNHILDGDDLLLDHRHAEWPTEAGIEAFFFFVGMMHPFEQWDPKLVTDRSR